MSKSASIRGWNETQRKKILGRCLRSLWWLSTEILGRTLLTEQFHKPMMDEMDQRVKLRLDGRYKKNELEMWARDHYKTTIRQCQLVQWILRNPEMTWCWWHAIEDNAQGAVAEAGRWFLDNDELRRLRPEIMPSKQFKKFVTATGFKMKANKSRDWTCRAIGAGAEATGYHSDGAVLDDIIGQNDIEDSLMPKKRRWFGSTVSNVVRTGGIIVGQATHWDIDDLYSDWRKHRDWDVRVRACYETNGVPDWDGEPVLYTREEVEKKRRNMSDYEFSCQMMNDPLPMESRMWDSQTCEHFISVKEASQGPGRYVVISDPAPKDVGSLSGVKEKQRGDGSGDFWSLCVVRVRRHGERRQIILVDGQHGRDWFRDEGLGRAAELMRKWGTSDFYNEYYGGLGADYTIDMQRVCDDMGVRRPRLERKGKGWSLPRFEDSHASGAKNLRFERLTDWARRGDFLICESTPKNFLEQDGYVGFLSQARNWRPLQKGRNSLKWDDDADVVSRATDSAILKLAPQPHVEYAVSPYAPIGDDEPEFTWGTRHVRA